MTKESSIDWTILCVLGAFVLLDCILLQIDGIFAATHNTILKIIDPVLPSLRPALARRRLRRRVAGARDAAVRLARSVGRERMLLEEAEALLPAAEAARYARDLEFEGDAKRIFESAVAEELAAGREPQGIAMALEAGLPLMVAEHYEKRGDMKHAGDHYERAGRPLDAARCFEKAGEAVRVVDVLASAGLRAELEQFLPRCTDPLATALARRRMPGNAPS